MAVKKRSIRARFFKICLAVLTVLSFEYAARALLSSDWVLETTPQLSAVRWERLWWKTHKQTETTVFVYDEFHPMLGWVPKKNAKNIRAGNGTVNINADGIRGNEQYGPYPEKGKKRIMVAGDSFAFGQGVNDDETFASNLEKNLPGTEVLNFAVHGYGTDQMMLRIELDGYTYHPDIVLYTFIYPDIYRSMLPFRDYMKPRYVITGKGLQMSNIPITPPDELYRQMNRRSGIIDLTRLLLDRIALRKESMIDPVPLANAIWEKMAADAHDHQAIPVFVMLPVAEEITDIQNGQLEGERVLFSFCSAHAVTCFSARDYLREAVQRGERLETTGHYTVRIHHLIADGLARDLLESNLVRYK